MLKDELKEISQSVDSKWDAKVLKYDLKTQKIISKLEKKLKKYAKKGEGCVDIYKYSYCCIVHPYLHDILAYPYLTRRGRFILEYLDKEEIKYRLVTHNSMIDSYFTIRVYFQ
ncbi:hypothetical protein [Priestia megaterium]|uniref:hypothetical protein n=1 Tax=Priestia megaterium TaxID=1404 RepID=UPI00112CF0B2|nr:hypothetical protein [Priestia megaterium]TPF17993.1 hypothetical protein CBE78_01845 [Priestia megaterium]TPF22101.1 hypothetical protein CBE79_04350 [Priestia megaterium]